LSDQFQAGIEKDEAGSAAKKKCGSWGDNNFASGEMATAGQTYN